MNQHKRLYLVSYDICDPQRLSRVARCLLRYGYRVQYSVFATEQTPEGLKRVLSELAELIDPKEDDIRAYPVQAQGEVTLMGQQLFPDDVMLLRDGHNLLQLRAKPKDVD